MQDVLLTDFSTDLRSDEDLARIPRGATLWVRQDSQDLLPAKVRAEHKFTGSDDLEVVSTFCFVV